MTPTCICCLYLLGFYIAIKVTALRRFSHSLQLDSDTDLSNSAHVHRELVMDSRSLYAQRQKEAKEARRSLISKRRSSRKASAKIAA